MKIKVMKTVRLILLLTLVVVGCKKDSVDPSIDAINYLNEVLDVMQMHAVNKKTIDWTSLRASAVAKADGAGSIEAVFPAIELALVGLGDNHSSYYAMNSTILSGNTKSTCMGSSSGVSAIANIGYVNVPTYIQSQSDLVTFATDLQTKIRNQDNENIKGWIVDLRENNGGNMWPMLAGIGPILGNGVAGYFIDADGVEDPYSYKDGTTVLSGASTTYVANFYKTIHEGLKVAVLVNARTASSGEAIAISFIGRPNTKSFGVASCGLSTAIKPYDLSDGATLALASAVMADRNKNKIAAGVIPDVVVTDSQEVVTKAVEWLNEP